MQRRTNRCAHAKWCDNSRLLTALLLVQTLQLVVIQSLNQAYELMVDTEIGEDVYWSVF